MQLTLADGRTAYAYSGGVAFDPTRPCVVFVHGALHDHSVFTLLARWFAHHGHCVLAVDLPGHGRTPGPMPSSVDTSAAWLWTMLDAAGVSRVALCGHSMGSLIALAAAAQQPERVTHLMLLGTAAPMAVSDALLTTAERDPLAAMQRVNVYSHSSLAAKPSHPGPGSWLHGSNLALMQRTQAAYPHGNLFAHDFRLCNDYSGALAAAARVRAAGTVSCTVVCGAQDQMTAPRQALPLQQALGAHPVTLPCGHAMMSEAPDALLQALREALASQIPSSSPPTPA